MIRTVATLAALAAISFSPASARADECADTELSEEAMEAITNAQDKEDAADGKGDDAGAQYKVPVHLHVIRTAPQGEGDMPVAHARAITLDVMNREFAAQHIPFTFELASIDYTNADDATYRLVQNSDEERDLYDALNRGGRRDLNIYIVGPNTSSRASGWAEFLVNPALRRGDHMVLRYYPTTKAFSDELTVVHEAGHWLGLLHTFQFGCGEVVHGDLIGDTATQKESHHSCAADTDTCPDDDGADPIDNIMGYSQGCRGTFTAGQIKRMKFLWRTARGGKGDDIVVPDETVTEAADGGGCATGGAAGLAPLSLALAGLRRRRR